MKLLITGREGQLARSLAERAGAREGIELIFAHRPDVDLERPGAITDAILKLRPDVVVNAAAFTDVERAEDESECAFRINAEAAGEAAEAAAAVGAAIIQLSTDYVFDGVASEPYGEDAPTVPINVYGASKLAGEERVRTANGRHLIIRSSWLVGPFGRNFVKTVMRLAKERDEIRVVADQRGSPTSTLRVADAILTVVERWREAGRAVFGVGQIFHVAGNGTCTWAELAEQVMDDSASLGAASARIIPIASSDYPTTVRRPPFSVLDSSRFERTFSFAPEHWRPMVAVLVKRLVREDGTMTP